jgi:hypothetical protein
VSGSPIKRRTEVKNTLPIGRIEGSKKPIETHTPLIRYFINDIGPSRTRRPSAFVSLIGGIAAAGSLTRRRVRREVIDIEHRPQQLGLGQDGVRLRDHTTGAVWVSELPPAFASSLDLAKVRAAVG